MSHSTFGLSCPLNYFAGKPLRGVCSCFLLNSLQFHRFQNVQPLTFAECETKRERLNDCFENMKHTNEKNFKPNKTKTKAMEKCYANKKCETKAERWKQRKYYKFYYMKWKGDDDCGGGGNINKTMKKNTIVRMNRNCMGRTATASRFNMRLFFHCRRCHDSIAVCCNRIRCFL